MSCSSLGFFVGAVPGIILLIVNAMKARGIYKRATQLALQQRKQFSFFWGPKDSFNFAFNPKALIESADEGELLEEKRKILSYRRAFFLRSFIAGIVLFGGALTGAIAWTAMTCPGWES